MSAHEEEEALHLVLSQGTLQQMMQNIVIGEQRRQQQFNQEKTEFDERQEEFQRQLQQLVQQPEYQSWGNCMLMCVEFFHVLKSMENKPLETDQYSAVSKFVANAEMLFPQAQPPWRQALQQLRENGDSDVQEMIWMMKKNDLVMEEFDVLMKLVPQGWAFSPNMPPVWQELYYELYSQWRDSFF